MKLFLLCFVVSTAAALRLTNKHPCDDFECKAGRECVVVEEQAQCLCVVSCPDRLKPVCGSDGLSYDNHCKLHQNACILGEHISVNHKGYCKTSSSKKWKKEKRKEEVRSREELEGVIENDLIDHLKKGATSARPTTQLRATTPAACFSPQRNALRFLIMGHWEEALKVQSWHVEGMTYRESLWGWFLSCDQNKDKFLTPEELVACTKDVEFVARPGQDNEFTKALCIDALVDDGDSNKDWRLDFEEFTTIMNQKYQPKEKKCFLEGRKYLDGEEVNADCNRCVCAVGDWVCASTDCVQEAQKKKKQQQQKKEHPLRLSQKDEMSNHLDESRPLRVDAVPVEDLWEKRIQEEKRKAKERKKTSEDDNLFLGFDFGEKRWKEERKKDKNLRGDIFGKKNSRDDILIEKKIRKEEKDDDLDAEEEEMMDDYYDDLLEKSKSKNGKKRMFQLKKALKELKTLRKKTDELQKLLKKEEERKDDEPKTTKAPQKKNGRTDSKKYYDEVFANTKWNDLIDWGSMEKLRTHPKNRGHLNTL